MNFQPASNAPTNPLPTRSNGVFLPTPIYPTRVGTPTPGLEYPGGVPALKPANDNAPRYAHEFVSRADRRAWLSSLPMPKNDSDIVPVLGCPTLARLNKAGDKTRIRALASWVDIMRPLHMQMSLNAGNDNGPTEEGWEKAFWAEPADLGDKLGTDRLLEIRPTVNEMMSASGRVSVSTKRSADGAWGKMEKRQNQLVIGKHDGKTRAAVGRNEIVGWFDRNGIERRAGVTPGSAKGSSKKVRSAADITRYLDRPGSPFPPQWMAHDGGRHWKRSEQAVAAQAVLDEAIANTAVMPPVTKCPTRIAKGAHWIGGVVASTGSSGGSLDAAAIEAELARTGAARRLRHRLGDVTAKVLDLATTRMTAGEIGGEFGYTGKYAERWAVGAIDRALDTLAA